MYGLLIASILLVNVFTAGANWLARRYKILPELRSRDVHKEVKPRVGGIAMWATIAFILAVILLQGDPNGWLNFSNVEVLGIDRSLWGIIAGMLVILLFGALDDLFDLKPKWQLLGHFLAGLVLVLFGVGVAVLKLPWEGYLHLNSLILHLPSWLGGDLMVWSALFTILWVMLLINVMNFFDGLDGLASSMTATACVMLFFLAGRFGYVATAALAMIVAGTAGGFLVWNWHPSKIIMGTVGSQLIGFMLAVLAIISGGKVATAVLVLGMPILDSIVVVALRLSRKQSPFKADQQHLHHRLLKIGIPVPWVVLAINAVGLVFGLLALGTQDSQVKGYLLLCVVACMFLFILATYRPIRK